MLDRQHDDDDQLAVPTREHDHLQWTSGYRTLPQLVEGIDADLTGWHAWVATGSSTTRKLNKLLQRQHNLPRTSIEARGYWIYGKSMGRSPADPDPSTAPQA